MPRIAYVFFAFLVITFTAAVTSSCSGGATADQPRQPSTNSWLNPTVYTDPLTGCQYLTYDDARSSMTPRLDRNGHIICTKEN